MCFVIIQLTKAPVGFSHAKKNEAVNAQEKKSALALKWYNFAVHISTNNKKILIALLVMQPGAYLTVEACV